MKKAKLFLAGIVALMLFVFSFQLVSANDINYVSSILWTDA
jgi:hypothetical protein